MRVYRGHRLQLSYWWWQAQEHNPLIDDYPQQAEGVVWQLWLDYLWTESHWLWFFNITGEKFSVQRYVPSQQLLRHICSCLHSHLVLHHSTCRVQRLRDLILDGCQERLGQEKQNSSRVPIHRSPHQWLRCGLRRVPWRGHKTYPLGQGQRERYHGSDRA